MSQRTAQPDTAEAYARDLVARARPIGPSDRILDLGCGTGIVARVLRERLGGAASIVAVDASPLMIETARSIAPELDWREGDPVALPFADGSFDLVLCRDVLQFGPDPAAVLREARRVLSPAGRLVASTRRSHPEQAGSPLPGALADAGFTDIRIETVTLTIGVPSAAQVATAIAP